MEADTSRQRVPQATSSLHRPFSAVFTALAAVLLLSSCDGRHGILAPAAAAPLPIPSMTGQGSTAALERAIEQSLSSSRKLQHSAQAAFEEVPPCTPLLDIITDAEPVEGTYVNFTEPPTLDVLVDCTSSSALFMFNGVHLAETVMEALPLVKILTLDPTGVTTWPGTVGSILPQGSLTVIHCHGNWLDLRLIPDNPPMTYTTLVVIECKVLTGDVVNMPSKQIWFFNSSAHLPCNGTMPFAAITDVSRDDPTIQDEAQFFLGNGSAAYFRHATTWCWTEADLEVIANYNSEQGSPAGTSSDGETILMAVILGVGLASLGLLVYCVGRVLAPRIFGLKPWLWSAAKASSFETQAASSSRPGTDLVSVQPRHDSRCFSGPPDRLSNQGYASSEHKERVSVTRSHPSTEGTPAPLRPQSQARHNPALDHPYVYQSHRLSAHQAGGMSSHSSPIPRPGSSRFA